MSGGGHATARLFLAVDPPEQVCLELAGLGPGCGGPADGPAPAARPELRALPAEVLHITLCFLGSRPVGEIDALAGCPSRPRPRSASCRWGRRCGCPRGARET